jgi:diguanylate cyclase (GGDEF)-like protein/putative nucleotidyltransferase with HDIG domain
MQACQVMPLKARVYIALMSVSGSLAFCWGIHPWSSQNLIRFAVYLGVTLISSGYKVSLPGVQGTMSVYFLFLLLSVTQLTLPETLGIAGAATLLACYWHAKRRPTAAQIAFNIGSNFLSATVTYSTYHSSFWSDLSLGVPSRLVFSALVFFVTNTAPVAIVIGLTEGKAASRIWKDCYFWSFPYYLVSSSLAGMFCWASSAVGWEATLLMFPIVIVLFRSYQLYIGRLDSEKLHAEEVASLHLRTIEALALAIEAKDEVTHDHVQRVQTYALEIGKDLGLEKEQLDALRAASLLHDIGKLAVPEHIISKPGKLSPEEFEKMKIHPIVGAEILKQVKFPYPVEPIVRSHHEKWNGTGYPDGLKGEEIPIGARILSAVDCLDALASDRQYRRAYPLDQAMLMVAAESGIAFDPKVVQILQRRYVELETIARIATAPEMPKLSTDARVVCGAAPDAGFEGPKPAESTVSTQPKAPADFLASIAAARQEVQALFEMAQHLGNSLSLSETLSVLATRLKRLVHFDALAIYVVRDQHLIPEYVIGEDQTLFSSLQIPVGQGLSGWVAENRKPIINGNPSVEPGYLNDPTKFSKLNSALAVPFEGCAGALGVLTLYRAEKDVFTRDQLRILQAITSKLAMAVENSMMYQQANVSATIDYVTGVPNARSLFMHLDSELSRCSRTSEPLTVIVCDLDGFKKVNDSFGHLAGNRLLSRVAAALKQSCREYDFVARMGGDEFVVVLPGMTADESKPRLRRMQMEVEKAAIEVCGELVVSLSAGEVQFGRDGATAEDLLSEGDRRMYGNKRRRKTEPYRSFVALPDDHFAMITS